MPSDYYKYIGDVTGTDLERRVYKVVRREIDDVLLRTNDHEEVRVSRDEWDYHHDMGMLEKRERF